MAKSSEVYQKMYSEVEGIIQKMEGGSVGLDEMVSEVEKGQKLIRKMLNRLQESKLTIESLKKDLVSAGEDSSAVSSSASPTSSLPDMPLLPEDVPPLEGKDLPF